MTYLISFADLVDYADPGVKKYKAGEEFFLHHLIYCGIKKICNEYVELIGLCLQTSNLSGPPLEINCTIYFQINPNIKHKCPCPAGQAGVCKHCIAILEYLVRTNS